MRKWLWAGVALALAGTSCGGPETPSANYETILYELGAYPVRRLTKSYWSNGHKGKVYSKNEREDVNGWIYPRNAADGRLLTPEEMKQAGIPKPPLSYERYIQILDVDTYKRTQDPLLGTAMLFTLDRMMWEETPLKAKEDVLKIYRAGIELDPGMLGDLYEWGLRRNSLSVAVPQLSLTEYMALYREYRDPWILFWGPKTESANPEYARFLLGLTEDKKIEWLRRWQCYERLYRTDPARYRVPFRDWMLAHLVEPEEWVVRSSMCGLLLEIGDDLSLAAVNRELLEDPVTECRESILWKTKDRKMTSFIEDAVRRLSRREGKDHSMENCMGREICFEGDWPEFRHYLEWASTDASVPPATREKMKQALADVQRWTERAP